MNLVSMKRDPKEAAENSGMTTLAAGDAPLYPWGLKLSLDDDQLKAMKLGLPEVGSKLMVTALAEVVTARAEKDQDGGTEISCELQITDMSLTSANGGPVASKLYSDADEE